ncbi:MAG: hypothetical protein VYE61_04675, partial [Pseudomonadota bacterium]|nr:hypothetical protein [Pseudomonadota bacterium]
LYRYRMSACPSGIHQKFSAKHAYSRNRSLQDYSQFIDCSGNHLQSPASVVHDAINIPKRKGWLSKKPQA